MEQNQKELKELLDVLKNQREDLRYIGEFENIKQLEKATVSTQRGDVCQIKMRLAEDNSPRILCYIGQGTWKEILVGDGIIYPSLWPDAITYRSKTVFDSNVKIKKLKSYVQKIKSTI